MSLVHKILAASVGIALAASVVAHERRASESRILRTDLRGENEVPPIDTNTRGRFLLHVDPDGVSAEYSLHVTDGERITQAHLHCAPAGANGPVVVFLAGLHAQGWDVDGRWIGNATLTDANVVNPACGATLAEVLEQARIGNVYVNVHSVAQPAGVVRGQLGDRRRR